MKYSDDQLGKFHEIKRKVERKVTLYIFLLFVYFFIVAFILNENIFSLIFLGSILFFIILEEEKIAFGLYDILENEITKFEEKNKQSLGRLQDDIIDSDARLHEQIHKELKKANINVSLIEE